MGKAVRELTRNERMKIRSLVTHLCANYDSEYGCLPLDCDCYMLEKFWTGALCRYFEDAVLPNNPELEASLCGIGFKVACPGCGRKFRAKTKERYCSDKCRLTARRKTYRKSKARERENKHGNVNR